MFSFLALCNPVRLCRVFYLITKKRKLRFNSMVIDPTNSTHTLSVVPRFYPDTLVVVSLYNEATKVTNTPVTSYDITNGKLNLTFDFTFVDKDRHQVKVTENNVVVYRGKLVTTTQEPQDFKETNDVYYYS